MIIASRILTTNGASRNIAFFTRCLSSSVTSGAASGTNPAAAAAAAASKPTTSPAAPSSNKSPNVPKNVPPKNNVATPNPNASKPPAKPAAQNNSINTNSNNSSNNSSSITNSSNASGSPNSSFKRPFNNNNSNSNNNNNSNVRVGSSNNNNNNNNSSGNNFSKPNSPINSNKQSPGSGNTTGTGRVALDGGKVAAPGVKKPVSIISGASPTPSISSISSNNSNSNSSSKSSTTSTKTTTPRSEAVSASTVVKPPLTTTWSAETPKSRAPSITVQNVKDLRSVLIQKDIPATIASLKLIANSGEGAVFDSSADMVYQPLLAVTDALFVDSNNIILVLNALTKLGFTWDKHRTFIMHVIGKYRSTNLEDLCMFVDSISELVDWDMLQEDLQKSIWKMIETAAGSNPDIAQLRSVLNMMSDLNAKWSNIPPHYQQLIEAEIEAMYQRESEKEKEGLTPKEKKELKDVGLQSPSEFMVELIVTLADLDYKNAAQLMSQAEAEAVAAKSSVRKLKRSDLDDDKGAN